MTGSRVAVTGAEGFLGWHARARAHAEGGPTTVPIGRTAFADVAALDQAIRGCDAVVHTAGVNRGDDTAVENGNAQLAHVLVSALRRTGSGATVVYANTTHADRDTPYGRGKARAATVLQGWADEAGARFVDVRLPNLFGEHGRPDYNSVVATFCRRLADDGIPHVTGDAEINLLHVQAAAAHLLAAARGGMPAPGPRGSQSPCAGCSTCSAPIGRRTEAVTCRRSPTISSWTCSTRCARRCSRPRTRSCPW